MNHVGEFFTGLSSSAEPKPLSLAVAGPVIACDVAAAVAVAYHMIATAANRAGARFATAGRDGGIHFGEATPGGAIGAYGADMTTRQLIGLLPSPA